MSLDELVYQIRAKGLPPNVMRPAVWGQSVEDKKFDLDKYDVFSNGTGLRFWKPKPQIIWESNSWTYTI